jgi:hypothetical protein
MTPEEHVLLWLIMAGMVGLIVFNTYLVSKGIKLINKKIREMEHKTDDV